MSAPTWTYRQSTGALRHIVVLVGVGYSGRSWAKNNPRWQRVPFFGPIPRGLFTIGAAIESAKLGKVVIPLTPQRGTKTYGRRGFYMHGDRVGHPGVASHGCIVMGLGIREMIAEHAGETLEVVA
jgi:hypothetical protein